MGITVAEIVPRGARLCNPCLLVKSDISWAGKVPSSDPRFEEFDTLENGVRAGARNFVTHWRWGLRTVAQLIEKHAPREENPTDSYIAFVASALGVGLDEPIDLLRLTTLIRFVRAVADFECDRWPIPAAVLQAGCARALS